MLQPTLSPDGKHGTLLLKPVHGGSSKLILLSFPSEKIPKTMTQELLNGAIKDVSWHPSSSLILYIKGTSKGNDAIFSYDLLHKKEVQMTEDGQSYEHPKFSPVY
jgi:Tol biopolymer transport system component